MSYLEPDPNKVKDRDSFVEFVQLLVAEREAGEKIEVGPSACERSTGAYGWQNGSISQFLECALAGSLAQGKWGNERGVSWQELAVFLYLGKIYE